jgi:hypothetical protein
MSTADITELKQDIELHRAELADTVDQLAAKLDVKSKVQPYVKPSLAALVGLSAVVLLVKRWRS